MRLAYVAKMFPRVSETFIANEIAELERHGIDVRIISLLPTSVKTLWPEVEGMARRTTVLPDPSTNRIRTFGLQCRLLARRPGRYLSAFGRVSLRGSRRAWKRFFQAGYLLDICDSEGLDHVHAAFAHTPTSVAYWVSRLGGPDYSFTAHAKDLYLSAVNSIRNKMEAARFVWTCTEANGVYLRGISSATPIVVGYHGIDLTRFRPGCGEAECEEHGLAGQATRDARDSNGQMQILTLCRHVPKKGLPHLIDAVAELQARGVGNFELVLGGDGPERASLEEQVERIGAGSVVRFAGTLLSDEVSRAYAQADLFVLPCVVLENGDRDGIPNVLVEAMAMGVPVVSTRVSGIPELVRDRVSGRLVEPGSAMALADAIEETLGSEVLRAEYAKAGLQQVRDRFDLHRNSGRLSDRLRAHASSRRVLYVSQDLGIPVRGHKGASAHVRQIANQLARNGVSLRVLTPEPGPEPPEGNAFSLPIDPVTPPPWVTRWMKRYPKGSTGRDILKEGRRLLHNANVLRALFRASRPDFVYERYALCAVATGIYCRLTRTPWILEVNAPLADEEAEFRGLRWGRLTRVLERWCLRNADQVFVVSHALRRWALGLGVDPDRVATLPNGVDRDRFHPDQEGVSKRTELGFAPDDIVVTFSGSLKPWHGGDVLLDAFVATHQNHPRLRLLFVGDGPERKTLAKRARKKGVEDIVRFTGAVPHEGVPALLAASDVLAAPYLPHDQFYFSPLKVLEYLAAGRPVVASSIGEIVELVDESCGRLVEPGKAKELSRALDELAGSAELRRELGAGARVRTRGADWADRARTILDRAESLRGVRDVPTPDRVGYVLKMFPRFSETFVLREVLELERQGMEVRTFSMKAPHGPRQAEADKVHALQSVLPDPNGMPSIDTIVRHVRCCLRRPHGYSRALRFAITRRDRKALEKFLQAGVVADCCARENIQHLHAHFASGPTRVVKLASMIGGVPYSFTAHAKDLYWHGHRHGTSKKLKKRVQLARFVAVISEENQRFIESQGFKVKEGRIRPLYIGLRMDDYRFRLPSERPRSPRPLILAVGRLIEKKGFPVLLEAAAELRRREIPFRLAIAGEGPEDDSLRSQIEELGLRGSVHMLGAVPLERLRKQYYSRARVLAQPCVVATDGDQDGIPTVLLEAMALGVPVISTRVSGIPEAISDGENGYLTDPGDVSLLADRIEGLLADVELADQIASKARERAELQFDLERNVGALRKLIRRSMAGWPSREEWIELQAAWDEGPEKNESAKEPVSISAASSELPAEGPLAAVVDEHALVRG